MECKQADELILLYDTLNDKEKRSLEQHMEKCSLCRDKFDFSKNIEKNIRSLVPSIEIPDSFTRNLHNRLSVEAAKKKAKTKYAKIGRFAKYSGIAACLAMALLLSNTMDVWDSKDNSQLLTDTDIVMAGNNRKSNEDNAKASEKNTEITIVDEASKTPEPVRASKQSQALVKKKTTESGAVPVPTKEPVSEQKPFDEAQPDDLPDMQENIATNDSVSEVVPQDEAVQMSLVPENLVGGIDMQSADEVLNEVESSGKMHVGTESDSGETINHSSVTSSGGGGSSSGATSSQTFVMKSMSGMEKYEPVLKDRKEYTIYADAVEDKRDDLVGCLEKFEASVNGAEYYLDISYMDKVKSYLEKNEIVYSQSSIDLNDEFDGLVSEYNKTCDKGADATAEEYESAARNTERILEIERMVSGFRVILQ